MYNLDFLRRLSLMGITLRAASNKLYAKLPCLYYNCPHAIHVHVHLFSFDLHKFNLFLFRSRAATCPTLNCGRGTSLLRELVYVGSDTSPRALNQIYGNLTKPRDLLHYKDSRDTECRLAASPRMHFWC